MKKSLKNKIIIGVPVIFIVVMLVVTVIVSVILSKQNRKAANTLIQNTFNIIRHTISERQEKLLFDSRQMASIDNMGRKIKYVTESRSYFKYDTLRPTYMKIAGVIYNTGTTANIWKAGIYNSGGDLMAFVVIEESGSTLGCIHNRETIETAFLKPDEELIRQSWTKQNSLPAGIEYNFGGDIPKEELIHFEIIGNSLCMVVYTPVMGEEYNTTTEKMEQTQVGVVVAVRKFCTAFVNNVSELSGTNVNIFAMDALLCGTYADYKTFDLGGFVDVEDGWTINKQQVTFNDVDIAEGSYFQGILPIYYNSRCIAAIVSLYSKKMAKASTAQIIKLLSLVYLVGIIVIVPITILVVVRGIINPIERIASMMREIAYKKDFTEMLKIESQDEIGDLASSFNEMTDNLRQTTTSIDNLNREIAERKKVEETLRVSRSELRQQNDFLNNVLESLTHPFYVIDANDYTIKMANTAARAGDLGKNLKCYALEHNGNQPCTGDHVCPLAEVKKTKKPVTVEHIHRDKDGYPRNVEIHGYPIFDRSGNVCEMIEYYFDITERKKAEAALRESEQRLTIVLNSILTGVVIIDAETHEIFDVNPLAVDLIGLPKEEITGKVCHKFICPAEKGNCPISDLDRTVNQSEQVLIRGDGKEIPILKTVSPIFWQGHSYLVESFIDITERKEAEQRQAQLLKELEKVNNELKDFAYVVSHDLKAPLRGINALTTWILTDYADKFDEKGRKQMTLLSHRVERMHNLIDGILQYSRVGRIHEEKIQVNLNELVSEIVDTIAVPEDITVTVEGELPVIEFEKTRITQVFQNLLSNAVKYMDKPQGKIEIGCVEENGFWKFSIADNGPGIEEKYFEKVFQLFQTLSPRDEFESTGVGLTLVKKIVELYGGRIWVDSKVGLGSVFLFTLLKQRKGAQDAKLEVNIAC